MTPLQLAVTVTKEGSLYFVRSRDMGACAETITEAFRLFGGLVESTSKPEPMEIKAAVFPDGSFCDPRYTLANYEGIKIRKFREVIE